MKYSSKKKYKGSKPSSFYDKDYFLNAKGSMYGKKKDGKYQFFPYTKKYQLDRDREFAVSVKKALNPDNVMILGCARGYMLRAFRELDIDSYGVDISEWAVKNSDPTIREYIYNGDVCDMSMWNDKSFDLVLAVDVLEHIKVPDLYTALDECTRISKLVFLGCPIAENDDNPDMSNEEEQSHVSVYSISWWIKQFYDRGFVPIEVKLFNNNKNTNTIFADAGSISKYLVFREDGMYKLAKLKEVNK